MEYRIATISGDGIGPEIVREAKKVLDKVGQKYGHNFNYEEVLMGGISIDTYGVPLTDEALETAKKSDAVLLGAVGGNVGNSRWYDVAPNLRPEAGLLAIRKGLNLFANIRPAYLYNDLAGACPLKQEIIGDGSQASYSIPVTITQPTITEAVLRERLFRDTLARTATNLNEGNAPRTNNVRLAAKAINGTILNPGDVFSYNTVVGERTQARGYQEAHAYSGGKIIDEFGGGVCQPSSTLYMAVLRADLEVVERHNHSFTVSYTPLGEDATVDYGNLDFRFANNTAYPIKILAEQTDGQMIMTIIGTKTSDKTVATRTEVLETYKPETVEKQDSSLAAGETQVETSGITGYSTRTYKVITENGKTTEVLANKSTYSKRDEVVCVGTGS